MAELEPYKIGQFSIPINEISENRAKILTYLNKEGPTSIVELSRALKMPRNTIWDNCQALSQKYIVLITPHHSPHGRPPVICCILGDERPIPDKYQL